MENDRKETKQEGCCREPEECGGKGSCGGCRCAAVLLAAVVLLLLGGILGYLVGSRCPGKAGPCPVVTQAPPPPAR